MKVFTRLILIALFFAGFSCSVSDKSNHFKCYYASRAPYVPGDQVIFSSPYSETGYSFFEATASYASYPVADPTAYNPAWYRYGDVPRNDTYNDMLDNKAGCNLY